jgi:hypothetical protein
MGVGDKTLRWGCVISAIGAASILAASIAIAS